MNEKKLFEEIGLIDDDLIMGADTVKKKVSSKRWFRITALAACMVFAIAVGSHFINFGYDLEKSSAGVTVKDVKFKKTIVNSSDSLVDMSEDEIINGERQIIVRGKITDINNIKINFGLSSSPVYNAVVTIKVEKSLKGDIKRDEHLKFLASCPIIEGVYSSTSRTNEKMKIGMEGIFIAKQYTDKDTYTENDKTLYLAELAPYGMPDGERYAFLYENAKLIYSDYTFEDLDTSDTLDDVQNYILNILK